MSHNVIVDEKLWMNANKANVEGDMLSIREHFADHFTGDTLSTDNWTATVGGSGDTIAIDAQNGGAVKMTTGGADNDSCHLGSAVIWSGAKEASVEWRVKIVDVSKTAIFVGLSDAVSESNGNIAIGYPSDTLTSTASDAVGFVVDADHASSSIMCCGVAGDTDETAVDSGIDWDDNETKNLRIVLKDGAAWFYVDGKGVGYGDACVTKTTKLCVALQAQTRDGAAQQVVYGFRADAWQDE